MKDIDLSTVSLGPLDAKDDRNLTKYFVSLSDFPDLVQKNLFVVVGAKGTGKSAIKRYISDIRIKKNKSTIEIDDSFGGFSLSQFKSASAAEIKNKMKGYLITLIISHLVEAPSISSRIKKELKKLVDDVPLIQKLLTPLTIKASIIEYAIKDLFPRKQQGELLKLLDSKVTNTITEAMGDQDLWIIFDDIDYVFTSNNDNASLEFIEGLIYAVSDFNNRTFKKKVWILLLLRSEIYEELTRMAVELDKEVSYIWEIQWNLDTLKQFLSERIRWALSIKEEKSIWKYWSLLFHVSTEKATLKLQDYLLERTINGPRDLLLLVDMSRKTAVKERKKKIQQRHIEETEYKYGRRKLGQITSNFQRIYQDIDHVIECIFRKGNQSYTRSQLETHINNNLLTDPDTREDFEKLQWLKTCNAFMVIQILYKVGCIGYWDLSQRRYIYVLEKSNLDKSLSPRTRFRLHSALAKYLELKPYSLGKTIKKKT